MYKENIDKEISTSLKNGEQLKLAVWRAIKNEFMKFRTSGTKEELTDEKELSIIKKMVQQRKDSYEQYINADRKELANAEKKEMEFLQSLLPNEPTIDEIESTIKEFADTHSDTLTMKHMREVMAFVKSKYPTADGSIISKIFRENYI